MPKHKVDLTLLKQFVSELETYINQVEGMMSNPSDPKFVVEASKAAGLAAGIMQEAGMLISDIHELVHGSQVSKSQGEFLNKLLGSLKGPGSAN